MRHPAVRIAPGTCYGRLDVPLAHPVDDVCRKLVGIAATVWSSPSQRCRDVAAALGSYRVDARLLELDFGLWEGVRWDDVPRGELDAWGIDVTLFSPPGGESGAALITRVREFLHDLGGGDHIVVSHGGPLKVAAALLQGRAVDLLAPAPPLGSVTFIPSR